jgi:hypothetical protein
MLKFLCEMVYRKNTRTCSYEKPVASHRAIWRLKSETERRDAEIIYIYRLILAQTRWNHFVVIFLRLVSPRLSHLQVSLLFAFLCQLEEQLR